ncbi:MAG: phage tail protein [Anaerolineae bacterium]|nr:phage tail protein [Anaerolineae bacterium]
MSEDPIRAAANAAFRFVVSVGGEGQAAFTECTLPAVELDVEPVKEGGLNTFVHQLPAQRKPAKLSLMNGVGKSSLLDWFMESMSGTPTRKNLTVSLLNAEKEAVMIWQIDDAFPTRWVGPQLQSSANTIAIQTLELACGEVTVSYE